MWWAGASLFKVEEKDMEPVIRFKGQEYLLIGNMEEGGAIATREQYESGQCSFAHLMEDGRVMRFREVIGSKSDIELVGECEPEIGIRALVGTLIDPSWTR